MTVKEMCAALGCTVLAEGTDNPVTGGYTCDLLSWAMGRLPESAAWLTVMGNRNVIAVASLKDAACVILTDSATLDENAAEAARDEEICVLQSEQDSYTLSVRLAELLK